LGMIGTLVSVSMSWFESSVALCVTKTCIQHRVKEMWIVYEITITQILSTSKDHSRVEQAKWDSLQHLTNTPQGRYCLPYTPMQVYYSQTTA
jgi:hypothetical protein